MKCARISEHATDFPVNRPCRLTGTSGSAYYDWLHRLPTTTEKEDRALTEIIAGAFKKSRATYGARRLKQALSKQNQPVSRRRTGRLMRDAHLDCKTRRKFKATTNSKHNHPVAENHLDRQFAVKQPGQAHAGDMAYIYTQEGWLYLALVIDLFYRQIVGWPMAGHMRTKPVNDAPLMAIWKQNRQKACFGIQIEEANRHLRAIGNY